MKTIISFVLITLISACNKASVDGDVTDGKHADVNVNGEYLWYNGSFPKTLLISNSFNSFESDRIKEMGVAWKSAVEDKKTFFSHGSTTTSEKSNSISSMDDLLDSTMGIYKTTSWPDSLPGYALAVTQLYGIRYNEGSYNEFVDIRHADILVNYDFYDFYTDEKDPDDFSQSDDYDLRTVVLHELGHFLGLQHKSGDTVMVTSVGPSTKNRAPTDTDKVTISSLYNISLSSLLASSQSAMMAAPSKTYTKNGSGKEVKILIELHASGECVHKEDGVIVKRHPANLKN